MAGFETVYERALALGIEGEAWVDGSFLTSKIEPKDVDFILIVDPEYRDKGTPEQVDFIEWLISNEQEPKNSLCCDTDVVIRYPENSPWYEHLTGSVLDHWQHEVYGKSVASGEPKGIVVVSLTKPKQSPPSAPGPANEGKEGDKR
jgi:hypothetical protein